MEIRPGNDLALFEAKIKCAVSLLQPEVAVDGAN